MKRKTIFTVAIVLMVACTNDTPSAGKDSTKPEYGQSETKPETRVLTDDIKKALNVPEAVFVTVFDQNGRVVVFEERGTESATYPVEAKRIKSLYTTTHIAFEGSHCVDRVDSTGTMRRICYPPH